MADTTDFRTKAQILADVWMEYRDDEAFVELFDFADLGFPLAYALDNGMIESTEVVEQFINSTWELLIKLLKVEDTGFESIIELFSAAEANEDK